MVDRTAVLSPILLLSGASAEPGSTPNADTPVLLTPAVALVVVMPSGSALVTPGASASRRHCCSVTVELA